MELIARGAPPVLVTMTCCGEETGPAMPSVGKERPPVFSELTGPLPLPDRLTVCWLEGLPPALSAKINCSEREPPTVGENLIATTQVAPAFKVAPHELEPMTKSFPAIETLEI